MAPAYNLFFGTFVQLPKLLPTGGKCALAVSQGALWVSTADGKIKGFDWNVRNDDDLMSLVQTKQWSVEDENLPNGVGPHEKVKIFRACEERNEFFFPGFIGELLSSILGSAFISNSN